MGEIIRTETLYKTDDPEHSEFAEYRFFRLDLDIVEKRRVYFVRGSHGWFDDREKRAVNPVQTLDPKEGLATLEEAEAAYEQQLHHCAKDGFVHSFSRNPDTPSGFSYRRLFNAPH